MGWYMDERMAPPSSSDGDGLMMYEVEDDFSMDIVDVFAILNEEPLQPNFNPRSNGNLQQQELAPIQCDSEQNFQADLEDLRETDPSQFKLEPLQKGELRSGFLDEYGGNSNGITGSLHFHASRYSDLSNFCDILPRNSSTRLALSCENNNDSMNAFEGSSRRSMICNPDQPPLQANMHEFCVPAEITKGAGFIHFPVEVNGYFNSEKEDNGCHVHGIAFQTTYEESNLNGNNSCSMSMPQNGVTDSSHVWLPENFNLSGEVFGNANSSAFPDSTVEDGYIHSSSMHSYMVPDSDAQDIVKPEMNTFEVSNVTCDGSNSCLIDVPMDFTSDAEIGWHQIVSAQLQSGYQCNSEESDRKEYHLLPLSELKLCTNDESPDSSLLDVSITDLESPLQDELCTDNNHFDDTSLMSESSTDSSPIPSSRSSNFDHFDRGVVNTSEYLVSGCNATGPSKPKSLVKNEMIDQLLQPWHANHNFLRVGSSAVQKNLPRSSISVEDDADICVLNDISDPVCLPCVPWHVKPQPMSQCPEVMGLRPNDERLTFRLALQDLSQPKSEASPPDGVMSVPLLRHQRIALSWMVQKETSSLHCSGGILADDQGLGKTVSTIALILMERSPPTRSTVVKKEDDYEALSLDDDDDDDDDDNVEASVMKQPNSSISMMLSKPVVKENSIMAIKGRLAAGTLVVCPTSVLRQWAEELQTKVTNKANLSFLVYHGSNRTKDPNELAKYDVVLTTYAIVSMEVPKQPLVDKDAEEKGKQDASGMSSELLLNSKKRKDPPTSKTKSQKGRITMDGASLESSARPLGRVGWFRVILDEAQSIKNPRTQVARACWGLRAKRRWCLSGTPIQNAVDDLYSYFRFLRYDPYAVYTSFCSRIKTPISRNPTAGYKKLQAVLKTIMLRRTKGTVLDGQPIITLPTKTISLKKAEFSKEERAFYSTLEAESREQFMEYEDAGTVKQNYVNILLMLLRLRQACDHPLLVKGCDSNSSQRSSMEMAKKLPRDKKIILLSCLEVSLAICTLCNDSPEDAVVTICGHVFCNQCICEHLTADENICPSSSCKTQLSAASIFSKATLKSSLSDELDIDCCSGSSAFEGNEYKKSQNSWFAYSSKIKATLEILQSLPRSQCSSKSSAEKSDGAPSNSSTNTTHSVIAMSSIDSSGIKHLKLKKSNIGVSEKAIIFSQWTRMLDLLEAPLKASCIQYRRLDGTMSVVAREKAVKDFKTLPEVTVIIMSLKAASLGLNLVAANHVILLDLWWNPTTEDQAIDRAHRIGQTRPVTVSRLTIRDTVEDKILSLQEKKREMVASAFGEDESGTRQSRLTVEDLRYLFTA